MKMSHGDIIGSDDESRTRENKIYDECLEERKLCPPRWTPFAERLTYGGLKPLVSQTIPGSIGLHGGLPPSCAFPITKITVELSNGDLVDVDGETSQRQYDVDSKGMPQLREWVENFTRQIVDLGPGDRHRSIITGSSSQGLDIATSLLLNSGDAILVEEFTYSHFLESLVRPRGFRIVPVETDDMGIRPKALAETLHRVKTTENLIPKILYVIPSGQNPTGSMSSMDRIKEIYLICEKYGIFILEDDPYSLLQFPLGKILENTSYERDVVQNSGKEEILRMMPGIEGIGKVPSYLSIDKSGIVIRLDSFSKTLAPGFRVGWVTAESCIIDKFSMAMQSMTIGASHLSQCLIFAILDHWGTEGWNQHIKKIQSIYGQRAAFTVLALEKHLTGLAEWINPKCGMFLWIKVVGVDDMSILISDLIQAGVLLAPGKIFSADPLVTSVPFLRLTYSNATFEQINEAVTKLGNVLQKLQE